MPRPFPSHFLTQTYTSLICTSDSNLSHSVDQETKAQQGDMNCPSPCDLLAGLADMETSLLTLKSIARSFTLSCPPCLSAPPVLAAVKDWQGLASNASLFATVTSSSPPCLSAPPVLAAVKDWQGLASNASLFLQQLPALTLRNSSWGELSFFPLLAIGWSVSS